MAGRFGLAHELRRQFWAVWEFLPASAAKSRNFCRLPAEIPRLPKIACSAYEKVEFLFNFHEKHDFLKKINQEKTRSENLVNKLKQTGQKDALWEQQVLSQSSQQKKLNEQQASLLERQRRELSELNAILAQREQVVYQFQNEKKSTQL